MTPPQPSPFHRLAIGLMLVAAAQVAGAEGGVTTALPEGRLASLAEYLAAFEAAHAGDSAALYPEGQPKAPQPGPSFQLREQLLLSGYRSLELDLGVDLTLPLYSARAGTSAGLAATGSAASRHEATFAHASKRVAFLGELASFAVFHQAERELSAALGRLEQSLVGRQSAKPPTELPAEARPLHELRSELGELRGLVSFLLAETVLRLARSVDRPAAALSPLGFHELLAEYPPYQADLERCLAASPAAAAARLRERLTSLSRDLQLTPDLRIELSATFGYASTSGASAAIGVHATLPLPDGWPFSGQLSVDLDQSGASQTLRLSWPNTTFSTPSGAAAFPSSAAEQYPGATLLEELEAVAAALRASAREHQQARLDRDRSELRLLWHVSDAARRSPWGTAPRSPEAAAEATHGDPSSEREVDAAPDPVQQLQAAELRVRLAFDELHLFSSGLALRLACGERPGAMAP